jgi:hypothetical protein
METCCSRRRMEQVVEVSRPTQQSSSLVQQEAELLIRDRLSDDLHVNLAAKRLNLGKAFVDVDGVAEDESVLVEIFAHQGSLKHGQRHKVQGDVLKLITMGKTRPASRLIVAFCDQQAANGVTGWLAHALEAWGVEKRTLKLPDEAPAS